MSSYELLELMEFMNERGAFKAALHKLGVARAIPWSQPEEAFFYGVNELAWLRAITYAGNGGEPYEPYTYKSPDHLELEEVIDPDAANEHAYSIN